VLLLWLSSQKKALHPHQMSAQAGKENLFTTRMNHETRAIHAIVIPAVCATVDESSKPD
jgi:hypothetical protein